ncbi:uncharacterized protein LOC115255793 [Aedes albopictus]|uniref:Secreted protein n=1 Tax=Aedes albopictus TaxID=7160 RepID=A0ABM1XVC8_AEDAL|nr:uncharacterized protein LOC109397749 [Aedes albopictus]
MVCFSDIKFHGYFIGTLAGLLEMASLGLSLYSHCVGGKGGGENGLAGDLQDLVSTSFADYIGDGLIVIAVGLMIYGIYKENRYCLIPFTLAICFDWVSYIVLNLDRSLPGHVWLLTSAFFIYVLVAMIGLFILFSMVIETPKDTDRRFVKFGSPDEAIV